MNTLKNIDLNSRKKLYFKPIEATTSPQKIEPKKVERPPTDEDIAFSFMLSENKYLQLLVDTFDLIAPKVVDVNKTTPDPKALKQPQRDIKTDKLKLLTTQILELENCYKAEEIIDKIKDKTKVNSQRAREGFKLMLDKETIEVMQGDWYILKGSTPF